MSTTSYSNQSAQSLKAIGVTLAIGLVICVVCFLAFGFAVYFQSTLIAPRCTARPKETIYHRHPWPKEKYKCQDRGNPTFGWILWVMRLSYDTLLNGVPGTGTRQKGLEGRMLQVNLDGVVLLRYHHVGFKVTLLISALALCIILPINLTANCYSKEGGLIDDCMDPRNETHLLTNFERTTMANISPLLLPLPANTTIAILLDKTYWWTGDYHILLRLYAIAFCSWVVYLHAGHLLKKEWKEILILRRVYYLEDEIWGRRKKELEALETFGLDDLNSSSSDDEAEEEHEEAVEQPVEPCVAQSTKIPPLQRGPKRGLPFELSFSFFPRATMTQIVEDRISHFQEQRQRRVEIGANKKSCLKDVWIFDPEERDTIPNVELYSVLVKNIPTSQSEIFSTDDPESSWSTSSGQEWQLNAVKAFFDQCVPNQPGYSSSVAAVTILPNATDLAKAWRSWYVCAAALRRLSFIRGIIGELKVEEATSRHSLFDGHEEGNGSEPLNFDRELFGSIDCTKIEMQLFEALEYGPEQTAVYSREFATGAFGCCPLGRNEAKIKKIRDLDTLKKLEKEALSNLSDAHHNLQHARKKATANALPSALGKSTFSNAPDDVNIDESVSSEIEIAENKSVTGRTKERPSIATNSIDAGNNRTLSFRQLKLVNFATTVEREGLLLDSEGKGRLVKNQVFHSIPLPTPIHSETRLGSCPDLSFDTCNPLAIAPRISADSDSKASRMSVQWLRAENIRHTITSQTTNIDRDRSAPMLNEYSLDDGVWEVPSNLEVFVTYIRESILKFFKDVKMWLIKHGKLTDDSHLKSSFAVVTFTSRQAAVAARHCLTDGRGRNQWISFEPLPLPPLADTAPFDLITCRGCCKPVTVTLGNNDLMIRGFLSTIALIVVYCFYTVPFTLVQSLVSDQKVFPWVQSLPGLKKFVGLIPSAINMLILSTLPYIFKALSNSSGKASSLAAAEGSALRYYWWFMLITAFASPYIATTLKGIFDFGNIQQSTQAMLTQVANTLPTETSFFWLNWLILRFSMTLPSSYLLQINSFLFSLLGWKCCLRMTSGGMNGSEVPFRIYVDSGAAFLCAVSLSFVSPLVAPAASLYYLLAIPLLRRNCIYVYRPTYDGGGFRWPFLFDIFISSMVLAQFLLAVILLVKAAVGCAFIAFVPLIPTIIFRNRCRQQYLKAFQDAGLLQTSTLDGMDPSAPTSQNKRKEFLEFLVDAHKAAYVPVCLAGDTVSALTATPAEVEPLDYDTNL